ncbi:MAG: type II toxin-antitoxin system HicB family antitoxin [Chloroflexota bacterium]|nr:type II toxin-antitoxin system HicB family antitoxin [Chloroflexota bacterium]
MNVRYVVVYQESANNYCAFLPDFPGCVSAGQTWQEIQGIVREALEFHIEGMIQHGDTLPTKPMTLREAVAYHNEPLTEGERETLAEFGEVSPNLSTTFGMVQVEIGIYAGAA